MITRMYLLRAEETVEAQGSVGHAVLAVARQGGSVLTAVLLQGRLPSQTGGGLE